MALGNPKLADRGSVDHKGSTESRSACFGLLTRTLDHQPPDSSALSAQAMTQPGERPMTDFALTEHRLPIWRAPRITIVSGKPRFKLRTPPASTWLLSIEQSIISLEPHISWPGSWLQDSEGWQDRMFLKLSARRGQVPLPLDSFLLSLNFREPSTNGPIKCSAVVCPLGVRIHLPSLSSRDRDETKQIKVELIDFSDMRFTRA